MLFMVSVSKDLISPSCSKQRRNIAVFNVVALTLTVFGEYLPDEYEHISLYHHQEQEKHHRQAGVEEIQPDSQKEYCS